MENIFRFKNEDQELYDIEINFVLNTIDKNSKLDEKTKLIIIIPSLIALNAISMFKDLIKIYLNKSLTPVTLKEIIYQSVPYIGIARVNDFLKATNDVFLELDIKLPLSKNRTVDSSNRYLKGEKIQKEIFGEAIDILKKNTPIEKKHIQDYLSSNCFGDFYTRKGLTLKEKELITFSTLVSIGCLPNQVKAHIKGNNNIGNNKDTLIEVVTLLLPFIGYPKTLNALDLI